MLEKEGAARSAKRRKQASNVQGDLCEPVSYHRLLFQKLAEGLTSGSLGVASGFGWLMQTFARRLKGRGVLDKRGSIDNAEDFLPVTAPSLSAFPLFARLLNLAEHKMHTVASIAGETPTSSGQLAAALEAACALLAAASREGVYVAIQDTPEGANVACLTRVGDTAVALLKSVTQTKQQPSVLKGALQALHCLLGLDHRALELHLGALWPLLLAACQEQEGDVVEVSVLLASQLLLIFSELRQLERVLLPLLNALRQLSTSQAGAAAVTLVTESPIFLTSLEQSVRALPEGQVAGLVSALAEELPATTSVLRVASSATKFAIPKKGYKRETGAVALALAELYGCVLDSVPATSANAVPLARALRSLASANLMHALQPAVNCWAAKGRQVAGQGAGWETADHEELRRCQSREAPAVQEGLLGLRIFLACRALLRRCNSLLPQQPLPVDEDLSHNAVQPGQPKKGPLWEMQGTLEELQLVAEGGSADALHWGGLESEHLLYCLDCLVIQEIGNSTFAKSPGGSCAENGAHPHEEKKTRSWSDEEKSMQQAALAGQLLANITPTSVTSSRVLRRDLQEQRHWQLLCQGLPLWTPAAPRSLLRSFMRSLLVHLTCSSLQVPLRTGSMAATSWELVKSSQFYELKHVRKAMSDALWREVKEAASLVASVDLFAEEQEEKPALLDAARDSSAQDASLLQVERLLQLLAWLPEGYLGPSSVARCSTALGALERAIHVALCGGSAGWPNKTPALRAGLAMQLARLLAASRTALAALAHSCRADMASVLGCPPGGDMASVDHWFWVPMHRCLEQSCDAASVGAAGIGGKVQIVHLEGLLGVMLSQTRSLLERCQCEGPEISELAAAVCHSLETACRALARQIAGANKEPLKFVPRSLALTPAGAAMALGARDGSFEMACKAAGVSAAAAGLLRRFAMQQAEGGREPSSFGGTTAEEKLAAAVGCSVSAFLGLDKETYNPEMFAKLWRRKGQAAGGTSLSPAASAPSADGEAEASVNLAKGGGSAADGNADAAYEGDLEAVQEMGAEDKDLGQCERWGHPANITGRQKVLLGILLSDQSLQGVASRLCLSQLLVAAAAALTIKAHLQMPRSGLDLMVASLIPWLGCMLSALHWLLDPRARNHAGTRTVMRSLQDEQLKEGALAFLADLGTLLPHMRPRPPLQLYRRLLLLHLDMGVEEGAARLSLQALMQGATPRALRVLLHALQDALAEQPASPEPAHALLLLLHSVAGQRRLQVVSEQTAGLISALLQLLQTLPPSATLQPALRSLSTIITRMRVYPASVHQVALCLQLPALLLAPNSQSGAATAHPSLETGHAIEECCRLLCAALRHRPRECRRCMALLGDSVRAILGQLALWQHVAQKGQEDVLLRSSLWLRRVYEEVAQHKSKLSKYCMHLLADYLLVLPGAATSGPALSRKVESVVRDGAFALIEACSPHDLQNLHATLAGGLPRLALARLKKAYDQLYKFSGKV